MKDFSGKLSNIQCSCQPVKISKLNNYIKAHYKEFYDYISDTCFGGVLQVHQKPLRVSVLLDIIQRWNMTDKKFVLDDGSEIFISCDDVTMVYGFPHDENLTDISNIENKGVDLTFARNLCSKYNIPVVQRGLSQVKGKDISRILTSRSSDFSDSPRDFWCLYVMAALFDLLIPSSNNAISLKYLHFWKLQKMR